MLQLIQIDMDKHFPTMTFKHAMLHNFVMWWVTTYIFTMLAWMQAENWHAQTFQGQGHSVNDAMLHNSN